ncbi:MAG: hypothetical protein Kow0077_13340 [Anaerolineae bacterium]
MQKSRRATKIWLILIGVMLGLALFSGAIASQFAVIGVGLYLLMVLAGLGVFDTDRLQRALAETREQAEQSRATRRRTRRPRIRTSSAAQKAQQRARNVSGTEAQFQLVDIGLIASEIRPDGLHMRRGDITLDDQGIQPYAVIHADNTWDGQTVPARFEIIDQSGDVLFRYDEEFYLREGQNNLLSSHRLPLGDKAPQNAEPGLWELRVTLAGEVLGLHTFAVGPSVAERRRLIRTLESRQARLRDEAAAARSDDDSPVSLEDLLRGQQ